MLVIFTPGSAFFSRDPKSRTRLDSEALTRGRRHVQTSSGGRAHCPGRRQPRHSGETLPPPPRPLLGRGTCEGRQETQLPSGSPAPLWAGSRHVLEDTAGSLRGSQRSHRARARCAAPPPPAQGPASGQGASPPVSPNAFNKQVPKEAGEENDRKCSHTHRETPARRTHSAIPPGTVRPVMAHSRPAAAALDPFLLYLGCSVIFPASP